MGVHKEALEDLVLKLSGNPNRIRNREIGDYLSDIINNATIEEYNFDAPPGHILDFNYDEDFEDFIESYYRRSKNSSRPFDVPSDKYGIEDRDSIMIMDKITKDRFNVITAKLNEYKGEEILLLTISEVKLNWLNDYYFERQISLPDFSYAITRRDKDLTHTINEAEVLDLLENDLEIFFHECAYFNRRLN